VWGTILIACGGDAGTQMMSGAKPPLVEAIRGIRDNGRVPVDAWKRLSGHLIKSESLLETLEGPREARVKAVESTLRELARGPED